MKKYYKYVGLCFLSLAILSCDNDDVYPPIEGETLATVVNANGVDFSNYVSLGASFTAGFTDGALFKAGQKNSFPNILASKFAMANGGDFKLPLMNDNIGGFVFGGQVDPKGRFNPRLYFNGSGPALLPGNPLDPMSPAALPTTEATTSIATSGPYKNVGIPGVKSFHLRIPGYATLNPYFGRIATSPTQTVLDYAASQMPTFFSLSEIGGNDVLEYALSGGESNTSAPNYSPITPTATFNASFDAIVAALTTGANSNAKGVVGNLPYITSLAHFTTVPFNALDPTTNTALAGQIPLLNTVYGALNQIYTNPAINQPNRVIQFSATGANAMVIKDENLTDLSGTITAILGNPANTAFIGFVQSMGLPAQAAPLVARLMGQQYGQARPATADDLFVLPGSSVIGTVNKVHARGLIAASGGLLPATLAGQFSAEGVTLPLADKWVLTPEEQTEIKTATDAYNTKISAVVSANPNLVLVDLNATLQEASTSGIQFDNYNMNTSLVTGGLIGLDGIHLTGRGYALMANKMLEAMDAGFGTNFGTATNGLAKADDYPTNYSPALR